MVNNFMNDYELNIKPNLDDNFLDVKNLGNEKYRKKIKRYYKSAKKIVGKKKNLLIAGSALGLHLAGVATGLYDTQPNFDILPHLLSAGTVAYFVKEFLEEEKVERYGKYVVGAVVAAGAVWEGIEYFFNIPHSMAQGNVVNTFKDMVVDVVGAKLAISGMEIKNSLVSYLDLLKSRII